MVQISERTELAHDEPFFDGIQDAEIPELRHETYTKVTLCRPDELDCSLLVELEYTDAEIELYQRAILANQSMLPIVIGNTGSIVAGRGRLEAALLIGVCEIPVLRLSSMTFDDLSHYLDIMVRYYQVADWTGEMLETDLRYLFKIDTMAKAAMTCSKRWAE